MAIYIVVGAVLIIIIIYLYSQLRAYIKGPTNTIGINNVVMTITPTTIKCATGGTFNVTVNAFGYSDTPTPRNYKIEIYDDEALDDLLDVYDSNTVATPGLNPVLIPGLKRPLYNWSVTHNFTLTCTTDCVVTGPSGSSGESDPEIYAYFSIFFGNPKPSMESTRIQIKCT